MKKKEILQTVITELKKNLQVLQEAQAAAYQAATHEESKPEDQYDTRGLEASYLAGAQSARLQELERSVNALENFSPKLFTNDSNVAVGALLELAQQNSSHWYFLLPFGAGVKVQVGNETITVVTPDSPLGKALLGLRVGDECKIQSPGGQKIYTLEGIQ